MGSVMVVVVAPLGQFDTNLMQGGEQCLVQLLIAQSPVEALDEAILHRLPGRDVVPFNPRLIAPGQNGIAGEFGSIVADNHRWLSPFEDEAAEFTRHPQARQ